MASTPSIRWAYLVSHVANVVRGPAGLEASHLSKLFIIQLKLKVQNHGQTPNVTEALQSICDAKFPVTSLRLLKEEDRMLPSPKNK